MHYRILFISHIIYFLFYFNHLFYTKFFLTSLLQFFLIKTSYNFFTIQITNDVRPGDYPFLILLITKISSDQLGLYLLAKMFLYFKLLHDHQLLGSFSLGSSFYSLTESDLKSIGLVLWYVLLYLSTIQFKISK